MALTKTPHRDNFREGRFVWSHSVRVLVHHDGEGIVDQLRSHGGNVGQNWSHDSGSINRESIRARENIAPRAQIW